MSGDAPGKRIISGRCVLAGGETRLFRRGWEHRRPIPAQTLAERGLPAYTGVGIGESKREFLVKRGRRDPMTNELKHEDPAVERDLEAYKMLVQLWASENPIKTTKLQLLLAVNTIFVSALKVSGKSLISSDAWFVYLAGAAFSLIWTFSIGRTVLFQQAWEIKIRDLCARHPNDSRFSVLDAKDAIKQAPRMQRIFGGFSSKWYLLFSPFVLAVAWIVILALAVSE